MTNYYEILGVENFAPFADIKTAYRRRSKQWHPDLHNGSAIYTEKFKELQEAYSCLNNDHSRADYDERLRAYLYGNFDDEQESGGRSYTYQTYTPPPYSGQQRKKPVISERTFLRFLWPFIYIVIRIATCHQDEPYLPGPSNVQIDVQTQPLFDSIRNKTSGDTFFNRVTVPEPSFPLGQNK